MHVECRSIPPIPSKPIQPLIHCTEIPLQAAYMLKKQRQAQAASGVKLKPEYKGPAPKPNRFNIK